MLDMRPPTWTGLSSALLTFLTTTAHLSAAAWPNTPFRADGRWIVDVAGSNVTYLGVNWPGHGEVMIPEGLQHTSVASVVSKIKSLGMNAVRLTYATEMVDQYFDNGEKDVTIETALVAALGKENGTKVLERILDNNPEFKATTTRLQVFDAVAAECAKQEIYLLLDNHVSKAGWCCNPFDGNSWWGDVHFSVANWTRGLSFMAEHTKSWPALTAMSLRNELRQPFTNFTFAQESYNWQTWYNYSKLGASTIHSTNPTPLILLSGMDSSTQFNVLVDGKPLSPGTEPFNRSSFAPGFSDRFALEMHAYSIVEKVTDCPSFEEKLDKQGFSTLTKPAEAQYPLLMTEFGFAQDNETWQTDVYATCITAYLPKQRVGWFIWVIAGSYYVREGTQEFDEAWGLLDVKWDKWRSPEFVENGLKKMVRETLEAVNGDESGNGEAKTPGNARVWSVSVNGHSQGPGAGNYLRAPPNDSPIMNLTSPALNCGGHGDKPAPGFVPVSAGDTVTWRWYYNDVNNPNDMIIHDSHQGPIITYIAKYTSGQPTGPVWTKIHQEGYDTSTKKFAVQKLIDNKGKKDVKIPATLADGKYIMRQEIIALHAAAKTWLEDRENGGAQPYPNCIQIEVTGGKGSAEPDQNFDINKGPQSRRDRRDEDDEDDEEAIIYTVDPIENPLDNPSANSPVDDDKMNHRLSSGTLAATDTSNFTLHVDISEADFPDMDDFSDTWMIHHPYDGSEEDPRNWRLNTFVAARHQAVGGTQAVVMWPVVETVGIALGDLTTWFWNPAMALPIPPPISSTITDLILASSDITACPAFGPLDLLRCLRQVVGPTIRRIHILPMDWAETEHNSVSLIASPSGRVYAFEVKSDTDRQPPHELRTQFQVRDALNNIDMVANHYVSGPAALPSAAAVQDDRFLPEDGTFNDEDAKAFLIHPMDLFGHQNHPRLTYGEVLRQMPGGGLLLNAGIHAALRTRCRFPWEARRDLRAAMEICAAAFPELEYISVLSEIVPVWRRNLRRPSLEEEEEEEDSE
ncbi:hypothetical protein VTJ49DRAFT_1697 [Mycothermus thermophilus]|uniref:Glycoside hydrolase family 5 domain-containing protein n=1 Tax=Humicola insolens TaxID=85995 RepID=A0ABR3VCA3_HUMIN